MIKKIGLHALILCAWYLPALVQAHGRITEPASRAVLCTSGFTNGNTDCANAGGWAANALENGKSFPSTKAEPTLYGDNPSGKPPPDGRIASAATSNGDFSVLDQQTATRWKKHPVKAGQKINFTWTFSAAHKTRQFRYFITKPNWDPNKPLTRASFDLEPFCTHESEKIAPWKIKSVAKNPTHNSCTLPTGYKGYHVILGIWDVADTGAAFYQVIDVDFGGGTTTQTPTTSNWHKVGETPNNVQALKVGDTAEIKVIAQDGHYMDELFTAVKIGTAQEAKNWSYKLAMAINSKHNEIQAGQLKDGHVEVVKDGANDFFAKKDSKVASIQLAFPSANRPDTIDPAIIDKNKDKNKNQNNNNGNTNIDNGNTGNMGAYPAYKPGIYKGGEIVSNNGKLYICRKGASAGWCGQAPFAYAPGTGSHWTDAWDEYHDTK